jgi:hypothetical protein
MIQKHKLSEEDYRGARFKDWHIFVQGNNDLLSLTQPKIIQDIHKDSDSEITLEDVKVWFFETEKLIRTTANLSLEVTSQQGIIFFNFSAIFARFSKSLT